MGILFGYAAFAVNAHVWGFGTVHHRFIRKSLLICNDKFFLWEDFKEFLGRRINEEEEETQEDALRVQIGLVCSHHESETHGDGENNYTLDYKTCTIVEELQIKNLRYTPPNYKSILKDISALASLFESRQEKFCIGVNTYVKVNYTPELKRFIEDAQDELIKDYKKVDKDIEVPSTWRHKKLFLTTTRPDAWHVLCNDAATVDKLRRWEWCLRLCCCMPLFELILGLFVGKLTIPLEYSVDLTPETFLDRSVLPTPQRESLTEKEEQIILRDVKKKSERKRRSSYNEMVEGGEDIELKVGRNSISRNALNIWATGSEGCVKQDFLAPQKEERRNLFKKKVKTFPETEKERCNEGISPSLNEPSISSNGRVTPTSNELVTTQSSYII